MREISDEEMERVYELEEECADLFESLCEAASREIEMRKKRKLQEKIDDMTDCDIEEMKMKSLYIF